MGDICCEPVHKLMALVPPPQDPVDCGDEQLWPDIESQLGTRLPTDYKQFINTYGCGEFYRFFGVISAFSLTPEGRSKLIDQKEYLQSRDSNGMWFHWAPLFPAAGGLLQCGGDENGNYLFWRTEGDPDSWRLAYASSDGCDFELLDLSLLEYLLAWLRREILPQVHEGVSIFDRNVPVFAPWKRRGVQS